MARMSDRGLTYWGETDALTFGCALWLSWGKRESNRDDPIRCDGRTSSCAARGNGRGGGWLALSALILAAKFCVKNLLFWLAFGSKRADLRRKRRALGGFFCLVRTQVKISSD
jgi:hypothetical protein